MNLIKNRILVNQMAVEFEKFQAAMADGKIDIEWSISKLALNGSVLSAEVTAKTEVGISIQNTLELDLKKLFQEVSAGVVLALADMVVFKMDEWDE